MHFQRGNISKSTLCICEMYPYTYFTLVMYKNQVAYNGEKVGII